MQCLGVLRHQAVRHQGRLPQNDPGSPDSQQAAQKSAAFLLVMPILPAAESKSFLCPFRCAILIIAKQKRQRLFQRCPLGGETIPYISFSIRVSPGEEGSVIYSIQGFVQFYNRKAVQERFFLTNRLLFVTMFLSEFSPT